MITNTITKIRDKATKTKNKDQSTNNHKKQQQQQKKNNRKVKAMGKITPTMRQGITCCFFLLLLFFSRGDTSIFLRIKEMESVLSI